MGRGGMLRISVPLLKKHMEEGGKTLTFARARVFICKKSLKQVRVVVYVYY